MHLVSFASSSADTKFQTGPRGLHLRLCYLPSSKFGLLELSHDPIYLRQNNIFWVETPIRYSWYETGVQGDCFEEPKMRELKREEQVRVARQRQLPYRE